MTRLERESMIGRYMCGGMTSAEEQEFFIQVALDPELRLELKAHRTVESAMRKDRDAEPTGHTALRGRIASTLAAHPPQPSTMAAAGEGTANTVSSLLGGTGMTFGKWAGGAIVLVVAAVWGVGLFQEPDVMPAGGTATETRVAMPAQPTDSSFSPTVAPSTPTRQVLPEKPVDGTELSNEGAPKQEIGSDPSASRQDHQSSGTSIEAGQREGASAAEKPSPTDPALPDLGSTPKRSTDDSLKVGLNIEVEVPKK